MTNVQGTMLTGLPPLVTPYFDSSVFIAHIKEENDPCRGTTRFDVTSALMEGAAAGRFQIYTSFFTFAEVRRSREVVKKLDDDEMTIAQQLFDRYMENDWIVGIEVGRIVGEKARLIGQRYDIKPPDAVHIASAILAKCNVLLVWDKPSFFNRLPPGPADGIREVEGVQVLEPYWEGLRPMPMPARRAESVAATLEAVEASAPKAPEPPVPIGKAPDGTTAPEGNSPDVTPDEPLTSPPSG